MGNYYRKYNLEPVSNVSAARQSGEISQDGKVFETKYSNRSDELELMEGQMIEVVGKPDDSWWQGRLNERFGVFPFNYVSGPFKIEKNQRNSISSTILKSEDTSMALPSRKSINSGCLSPIVFSRKNTISSSLF